MWDAFWIAISGIFTDFLTQLITAIVTFMQSGAT
jgi:hypothetical protein